MSNGKSSKLWIVNVISFTLFTVLSATGLINWLALPKGYQARGSFLITLRHFLLSVHEWAAVIFMIMILIHMALHWAYIKSNLKKYGIITKHPPA